jgi:uncharacterized membrane protein YeaQ/YmgE (transglycosylase-associated protein family)
MKHHANIYRAAIWNQRRKQKGKIPMDITSLIVEAVSGAVGANVAGAAMKEKSLWTIGNSIAGIVGGGIGGTILQAVMGSAAAGQRRRVAARSTETEGSEYRVEHAHRPWAATLMNRLRTLLVRFLALSAVAVFGILR